MDSQKLISFNTVCTSYSQQQVVSVAFGNDKQFQRWRCITKSVSSGWSINATWLAAIVFRIL